MKLDKGFVFFFQTLIPTTAPSEEDRLEELQRRNTLCLPHLKSSYPMELSVNKENARPEDIVQDKRDQRGKRKVEEEGPRGTYKKWKTENSLSLSNDLSYLGRSTRSDSNLRRDTLSIASKEVEELPAKQAPQQSYAFEVVMEPPKKMRPNRMTRSVASGNLKNAAESGQSVLTERTTAKMKNQVTTKTTVPKTKDGIANKSTTGRFHRGEGVRSSFKNATQKVAASFRGRKVAK
jgi:hypothetical protein